MAYHGKKWTGKVGSGRTHVRADAVPCYSFLARFMGGALLLVPREIHARSCVRVLCTRCTYTRTVQTVCSSYSHTFYLPATFNAVALSTSMPLAHCQAQRSWHLGLSPSPSSSRTRCSGYRRTAPLILFDAPPSPEEEMSEEREGRDIECSVRGPTACRLEIRRPEKPPLAPSEDQQDNCRSGSVCL